MSSSVRSAAEQRWAQIALEQPSLAPALRIQQRLLAHQFELAERAIGFTRETGTGPSAAEVVETLSGGLPAFTRLAAGTAELGPVLLPEAFLGVLADLEGTGGQQAASRIARAIESTQVEIRPLLVSTLHRRQAEVREVAAAHGLNLQVLWYAAELVTAPLAWGWQARLLGVTPPDDRVRDAVARWDLGRCPACGSWPALAEFFHGQRLNRCAYCSADWPLSSDRCTFCGVADARFGTVVPDRERPGRRLELCRGCGGYLKTLDVGRPSPFPLVAIEDLASSDLDRAALHHGYTRTPLEGPN